MILSLDVRRARKGDCLLLHYGTKDDPGLVLIDGGPSKVYKPHLKPRLADIRKARRLGDNDPLPVDLMMVSHIDDDHVNGILELTKELIVTQSARRPLPLKIRGLWHNTFDDVIGNSPKELRSAVTAQFGAASLSGEPDVEGLDPAVAMVLASLEQGVRLRDDARKLKLSLNPHHNGRMVMVDGKAKPIDMGRGLTFTVVGPMQAELVALQKEHDAWLKQQAAKKTRAALASFTDSSAANLSSIVVLAAAGGKRMLLTGDARGDKIIQGLEMARVLKPGGTLHVDVLKMPHHGSDRNMEPSFLERVTADHYVFSGDGEHGNPERATFDMLLQARGDADYAVHLTYPVAQIDVGRKRDWMKERKKELSRRRKAPGTDVREVWSNRKHALGDLLAANRRLARKVRVVEEGGSHVINLLDAIRF
jgi:hypothetical protein